MDFTEELEQSGADTIMSYEEYIKISVLRNRDVYPGSRILIISDPGSRIQKQQQKKGVKKISCQIFFCSHKFHKTENYFIF